MTRLLRYTLLGLLVAIGLIALLIYSLTWRPEAKEVLPVSCNAQAPTLVPGQALKVMTWNVQYLAGKRYVFWNDLAGHQCRCLSIAADGQNFLGFGAPGQAVDQQGNQADRNQQAQQGVAQ